MGPADKVQFTVEIFEALIVTCIESLRRDVPECHAHRVKGYFEQFTAQNQENDFLRFLKNASCFNYKMIGSKTLRKRIVNYTLQVLREQVSNDDTFIEIFEALIVTCIQSLRRDVPECHAHRVKGYFEQFAAQNQENDFLRFLKNASCF